MVPTWTGPFWASRTSPRRLVTKGPFSEPSRSAQGLTAGRRKTLGLVRGEGAHAGLLRVTRVLSGCGLRGGRGTRDSWEGGLSEEGDAGHALSRESCPRASWLRDKSAAHPESHGPLGLHGCFSSGIILLFHIQLSVCQLPSVGGGENAYLCPGEVSLRGPLT